MSHFQMCSVLLDCIDPQNIPTSGYFLILSPLADILQLVVRYDSRFHSIHGGVKGCSGTNNQ